VVVVSRDRAGELSSALSAIEAQRLSRGSFEIVVVDDGSTDGTGEMLSAMLRSPSGEWQPGRSVIRNELSIGPGRARNLGVERARAPIVAFTDSDCTPAVDWLEELLAPFDDPRVGAVGGRESDDPADPAMARAVHFAMTSPLTTGRVRGGRGRRAGRYRPRSFNMAARRDAFLRAGGFADAYYGEDIDLSLRIDRLGFISEFAPKSRVHHRRRRTPGGIWTQAFAMGRARARLMRSDRGHAEFVYALPTLVLAFAFALTVAAIASPTARGLTSAALGVAALYLLAVGWEALRTAGDLRVALLAPLVFILQQTAYGAGFLAGLLRRTREEYAR
jgi:GT2 family glycosyltransferase